MPDLATLARRAARRKATADAIRVGGPAMLTACAGSALAVGVDRLVGLGAPLPLLIAGPLAFGVAFIAWRVWRSRRGAHAALARVDHALAMRDRLSNGLAFEAAGDDDPFARAAVREAADAATSVRLRRAIPVRFDWTWWAWPAALAIAISAGALVPSRAATARQRQAEAEQATRSAADDARRDVQAAAERAAALTRDDAEDPESLRVLDDIARQLDEGATTPDGARAGAADALSDLADDLEQDAEQSERESEALQERFDGVAPEDTDEADPGADALGRALEEFDLDRAGEALDEMRERVGRMTPEERERLARDLESLSDAIARRNADDAQAPDAPEPSPEEIRDRMLEEGADPADAQRAFDEAQERERSRDAERSAEERARDLEEALRDAAERVREPQPPADQPQDAQPEQQPSDQSQDSQRDGQAEGSPETGRQGGGEQTGEQEERQPTPQQSQEGGPGQQQPGQAQNEGEQQGAGEEQAEGQRPQEGSDGESGEQAQDRTSPESGEEEIGEAGEGGNRQGTPEPGATPTPGQESPPEGGAEDAGAPSPDGSPGSPAGDGPPDEQAIERARRVIEEMRRRQEQGGQQRENAERVREEAERMLEEMSPEQREQMRRWAEALEEQQSGDSDDGPGVGSRGDGPTTASRPAERAPVETEGVDARREPEVAGDDERVVGEWYNPMGPERAAPGEVDSQAQRRLRDAAEAAERAVEDQAVPNRYRDLVKRYFRRLPEMAPAPGSPPPAEDVRPREGGSEAEGTDTGAR
ncbi:MAG: hypothetical protein ACF8QF_11535 [Phycisphaerales bacterium]